MHPGICDSGESVMYSTGTGSGGMIVDYCGSCVCVCVLFTTVLNITRWIRDC